MVIVYTSNTGFTARYAGMLGKAEKLKYYTLEEAQDKVTAQDEVLYMGPLMAGRIEGLEAARNNRRSGKLFCMSITSKFRASVRD